MTGSIPVPPGDERSRVLLDGMRRDVGRTAHRLFAVLLPLQWLLAVGAAYIVSLFDWDGAMGWRAVLTAWLGVGLCTAGPLAAMRWRPDAALTRLVVSVGQVLTASLFVPLTAGRIDGHVHLIASLAFIACYRDWRLVVAAAAVAIGELSARAWFWPPSVSVGEAGLGVLPLERGGWILLETLALAWYCWCADQAMRADASRRADVDAHRKRAEALVDQTADGIVVFDAATHDVLEWNPAFVNLIAATPDRLRGRPVTTVVRCREEEASIVAEVPALMADRQPRAVAHRLLREDGRTVEVAGTLSPATFAGRPAVCAMMRDVSAHTVMEAELAQARDAALESARLKSEFLANMSHEIRTPMNGVLGMAGLLLDGKLEPEQRECVQTIETSAVALLHIINEILDFSKIESGRMELEATTFEVRETVEGIADLLAAKAQAKGIEIASLIEADVPSHLRGDAGRLRQVLLNLVGNAVKFTERGEVAVHVVIHDSDDEATTLCFEVRDSGVGIPAEGRARLFQPFTQVDGSTTRRHGGTGLGLVISKRLVALMGGEIGVTSEPGVGSTFWFTARFTRPAHATNQGPRVDLAGLHALVVEDNDVVCGLLKHRLAGWKVRAHIVSSVEDALASLQSAPVDAPYSLALIDRDIRGASGLALVRRIRQEPAWAALPILFMTPMGTAIDDDGAGVDDGLIRVSKPLKMKPLLDALEAVALGHRRTSVPRRATPAADPAAVPVVRVLVAEDNATNQKVILAQLRQLGCSAMAVAHGGEVLPALQSAPYDLVLMDCQMPHMDGFEATRVIRRAPGALGRLPIIAMTANALTADRARCLEAGMDDYVSKPVKLDVLRRLLIAWRGGRMGGIRGLERPA